MPHTDEHDTLIDRLPELGERWGSYVLDERIASGGMADVFRARRVGAASFSRQVCLKRMHAHLGTEAEMVTLFLDEALIGSKLRHRNIVAVEDLGEHEGRFFLAMEYVNGVDLRVIGRRSVEQSSLLPWEAVAYVASEMLSALHAVHTAIDPDTQRPMKIVHRDISPQNVMVAFSGQVKLADFGVARAEGRRRVTESRSVCGKIGYMPLEQASGASVDARADLFALGVTLFETLTGRRPFAADRTKPTREQILAAMMNDQRPRLRDLRPDVSPAFESVIDAMLTIAPQRRLPSALAGLEMMDRVNERLRGGRLLVEWLALMFPGQGSVASISRAALAITSALPTPRVGATGETMTASVVNTTHIDAVPVEATRQIRRGSAHVPALPAPPTTNDASPSAPSNTPIELLSPPSLTAVEAARRDEPSGSLRLATVAGLLAIALASCAATLWMLGRTDHGVALRASFPSAHALTAAAVSLLPRALASRPAETTGPTETGPTETHRAVGARRDAPLATPPPGEPPRAAEAQSNHATRSSRGTSRSARNAAPRRVENAIAVFAPPSTLTVATGTLRVVALPWGEVQIDGRDYGAAPVSVSIAAGNHRVRVTGGVDRVERIDVTAGQTTVLRIDE